MKYYSCDPEVIYCETVHEAVIDAVDWEPRKNDTITVTEYRPIELPHQGHLADVVLEFILDWMDEDYGGIDDRHHDNNREVLKGDAYTFAKAVREKYKTDMLEPVRSWEENLSDHFDDLLMPPDEDCYSCLGTGKIQGWGRAHGRPCPCLEREDE